MYLFTRALTFVVFLSNCPYVPACPLKQALVGFIYLLIYLFIYLCPRCLSSIRFPELG